jgi:hypothetical protein
LPENPTKPGDGDLAVAAVRYLDGMLTGPELERFNAALRADPAKRAAFVDLCLTRAGLIEEVKEQAEFVRNAADPEDLSETMVSPALTLPGDLEEEPEIIPPTYPVAASRKKPWPYWRAAAGLLVAATVGVVVWAMRSTETNPKPQAVVQTEHPMRNAPAAPGQTVVPQKTAASSAVPAGSEPAVPKPAPESAPESAPEPDRGRVTLALDARWAGESPAPVTRGPHHLISGVLKIDFNDRASLVIQGPADFEIVSDSNVVLTGGRLCATLPHTGASLTVTTPDMKAVDLGTEFGLDVRPGKQTYLEVFEGHVRAEASAPGGKTSTETLSANQAIVSADGAIQPAAARPLVFVRAGEIAKVSAADNSPLRRWLGFSQSVRLDPDLIAYYPFDNRQQVPDELLNRAAATAGRHDGYFGNGPGSTAVPHWDAGRWPGKDALSFGNGSPSGVCFADAADLIPPSSISVCVWLKRSELSKPVHFMHGTAANTVRFNLELMGSNDKPGLGLVGNTAYLTWSAKDIPSGAVLPTDNRWYLLCITADAAGATNFFIDGQPVSAAASGGTAGSPVEALVLGEPVTGTIGVDLRDYFNGSVDELMIFKRVLSPEEIRRIYKAGGAY